MSYALSASIAFIPCLPLHIQLKAHKVILIGHPCEVEEQFETFPLSSEYC